MQYVGHLDLQRSWERAFRRSGLPLEYSQGFHPQPKLSLACALPVGFTSECELLDARIGQDLPLGEVQQVITAALPPGLHVIEVTKVDEHSPALQTQVVSAIYLVTFLDDIPDLLERTQKIEDAVALPRIRHDKSYDLRPLIETMTPVLLDSEAQVGLRVQMATRDGATGRPEELLDEMGIRFADTHVHREQLILTAS